MPKLYRLYKPVTQDLIT